MYDVFGLQYRMALSTRPEKYMGDLSQWDIAEQSLTDALNQSGHQWEVQHLLPLCVPARLHTVCDTGRPLCRTRGRGGGGPRTDRGCRTDRGRRTDQGRRTD